MEGSIVRYYCLLVLVFFCQSTQAQMYQWNDPETGTTQLSGKPPAWYRSVEGGPRVFVFNRGKVVDDTGKVLYQMLLLALLLLRQLRQVMRLVLARIRISLMFSTIFRIVVRCLYINYIYYVGIIKPAKAGFIF